MTRLKFLLVTLLGAVGACWPWRRKLSRADFVVAVVEITLSGAPRLRAVVCNLKESSFVHFDSPSLEFVSEGIARMDVTQAAEDAIEDRILELNNEDWV